MAFLQKISQKLDEIGKCYNINIILFAQMKYPLLFIIMGTLTLDVLRAEERVLFDFESGPEWTMEGDAISVTDRIAGRGRIPGLEGTKALSSGGGAASAQGRAVSPVFTIDRDYLNFLVGGDRTWPDVLGMRLLVEGKVVRSAAGRYVIPQHDRGLLPMTWDVHDLKGKSAQIEMVDRSKAGAIWADAFRLSDTPISPPSDATVRFEETFRPRFHFTAPEGWLADPNGPMFYGGKWRMCHQYGFVGARGRAWGQAESKDLIHWEELPPALLADGEQQYLSGGGVVDWKNDSGLGKDGKPPLLLFPTRVPRGPGWETKPWTVEMVYSTDEGVTWQRAPNSPLLTTKDLNDRDSRVFSHEGRWYLLFHLSNNNVKEGSAYGLYRTTNFKEWEFLQRIEGMWENPDMFPLPLDGDAAKTKWVLMESRGNYKVGAFDGEKFTPETELIPGHFGGNYYGGGTFSDAPDGRRIQMAWMNTGKKSDKSYPGMPFVEQMTFPVELTLKSTPEGPRLNYWPVGEIETIRGEKVEWKDRTLPEGTTPVPEVAGDLLDLRVVIEPGTAKQVGLMLRGQPLIYDVAKQELSVPEDGKYPYLLEGMVRRNKPIPLPLKDGRLDLRVLLDKASLEVYALGGTRRFSCTFYPPADAPKLEFTAAGGEAKIVELTAWELSP